MPEKLNAPTKQLNVILRYYALHWKMLTLTHCVVCDADLMYLRMRIHADFLVRNQIRQTLF